MLTSHDGLNAKSNNQAYVMDDPRLKQTNMH